MNQIPKIILLCGAPGSGKTTYAKKYINEHPNTVHFSSDAIRAELYGSESTQGNPAEVFTLMQQRAVEALNNGRNIIYDCTNMTRKDRSVIINSCPKFAQIECFVIWAPIETCIARDAARERTVGKEVIDKMLKRFQFPYYDEGIDVVKVVEPEDFNYEKYLGDVINSMKIPHDNPHHTLNIFDHCFEARMYAVHNYFGSTIANAAYLHDCGKPYVKSFTNTKGEVTDTAHYYQHQCLSTWIACGIASSPDILWLISTHMDVFGNTKYYRNLPPYLKQMVDQLHKCDIEAH